MNDDMNSDNIHDKIDYAKTVLEHNFQLINFADTKGGIILGINGVILALLFGIDEKEISYNTFYLLVLSTIIFGISSFFSILAIFPRLSKGISTKLYSDDTEKKNLKDYRRSWNDFQNIQILDEYLSNIHNLMTIKNKKYLYLKFSMLLLPTGLLFLILTLYLYFLFPNR